MNIGTFILNWDYTSMSDWEDINTEGLELLGNGRKETDQ